MGDAKTIRVNNVFTSFDGEVSSFYQGRISTFVRLQGCNLRCSYCDARQTWDKDKGEEMDIQTLAREVVKKGANKITITGGEPFLQPDALVALVNHIYEANPDAGISIETNGTIPVLKELSEDVCIVMDCKLEGDKIAHESFGNLNEQDFIKFVVKGRKDFVKATEQIIPLLEELLCPMPQIAFSPIHGKVEPQELAKWILEADLPDAIINLQLHKYIWPDAKCDV